MASQRKTYTIELVYQYEGSDVQYAGGNAKEAVEVFNGMLDRADLRTETVILSVWQGGKITGYLNDSDGKVQGALITRPV